MAGRAAFRVEPLRMAGNDGGDGRRGVRGLDDAGISQTMNDKRSPPPGKPRIPQPAHPERREQPLPWHRPKPRDEDPDALDRVRAILASPSYRLAEQEQTFFA